MIKKCVNTQQSDEWAGGTSERRRIYLHIGLHKTGSTSFQEYCRENQEELRRQNLIWYQPMVAQSNAHELATASLRPGVMEPPSWYSGPVSVRKYLQNFLQSNGDKNVLISTEALSFIRTDQECRALRSLFGQEALRSEIVILVVIRDSKEWWKSYSNEIKKSRAGVSCDPRSYRHLDADGWLTDFSSLLNVMQKNFSKLQTIPYTKEDVVPSLLKTIGIDSDGLAKAQRLNARDPIPQIRSWYKKYLAETMVGRLYRRCKAFIGLRTNFSNW